jgi:hypothetical protein
MKTNFNEIVIKVRLVESTKIENLLGNASVTLKDKDGTDKLSISGFTIWRSKFEGYNVTGPRSNKFDYWLPEAGFKQRLVAEIIKEYEIARIPVID